MARVAKRGPGTLADKIRKARKEKGWSQAEFARRVGISRSGVNQWEQGTSGPSRDQWPTLSNLFGWRFGPPSDTNQGTVGDEMGASRARDERKERRFRRLRWGDVMRHAVEGIVPESYVSTDSELPGDTYFTLVPDDAMHPVTPEGVGGYGPGDRIAVSPSMEPRDGHVVVAMIDGQDAPILREYRRRGNAVDLIASNGDYPTQSITVRTPGRIGGVVIEHTRRVG
jgi:transcriptional regulator with XRE-family HTH domain